MALYRNMWRDLKVTTPFLVDVIGKAVIGGSGAVASQTGRGAVLTKAVGTGAYTLTLDARGGVADILCAEFWLPNNLIKYDVHTTAVIPVGGIINIQVLVGGTPTAPAGGTLIGYRVVVQNAKYTG